MEDSLRARGGFPYLSKRGIDQIARKHFKNMAVLFCLY